MYLTTPQASIKCVFNVTVRLTLSKNKVKKRHHQVYKKVDSMTSWC